MTVMTIKEAMEHAANAVYMDRLTAIQQYGREVFDEVVDYYMRAGFRADLHSGVTLDSAGEISRFTDYDWAEEYKENPHFVWFDFFRPSVMHRCFAEYKCDFKGDFK